MAANDSNLLETLESFQNKYDQLNKELETSTNGSDIIRINKEISKLQKIVDKFTIYKKELQNIKDCIEIIKKEESGEMVKLAQTELESSKQNVKNMEEEFKKLLIPVEPLDEKSVIIEMRAAAGGDEASIFVSDLFGVYKKYADLNEWTLTVMDLNENSSGIYFLAFSLVGDSVYSKMKFESGVHRVQRVPITESKGRVHTSTITVSVMPEQDEIEIHIEPSDLRIDVYRASGAGGQHVNKTESSVRITHLPTGIIVACQQERSQIQNRANAMKMLRSKLWEQKQEQLTKELNATIKKQVGTGERSEKIRTYNYPQNRITDHRVSLTLNKLHEIMLSGNLAEIHEALINDQAKESLENVMKNNTQK